MANEHVHIIFRTILEPLMPTDIGTQFDFSCMHTPACPSWWCCERRGSYENAKARYAEHHRPIVTGRTYEQRVLGGTKEGAAVYEQVEKGTL